MKLSCAIGGHGARGGEVYNSGYYFSECRRCGTTLIRAAKGDWSPVPMGHRVVWGPGPRSHSLEADYAGVLPIAQLDEASLPALRSPFVSWSRSLTRLRGPAAATANGATPAGAREESGDYDYPRLLLLGLVLGAGLRMLLSLTGGR